MFYRKSGRTDDILVGDGPFQRLRAVELLRLLRIRLRHPVGGAALAAAPPRSPICHDVKTACAKPAFSGAPFGIKTP
eukprot:1179313-Prorocentrum_minimum.AAC.1